MNKKLGLAVAGALLAASASANAGITIPAGDWTVDIGGNVNAFYAHTSYSGDLKSSTAGEVSSRSSNTIQTGLLPTALGIGAKTRQNDLDISVQFSFFTGINGSSGDNLHNSGTAAVGNGGLGYNSLNIRQAFLTFGDASWGTVKMGRDLGVYASDAILSDMTLLGVGSNGGSTGSSTLGRIGSGYQYADWYAQIQYQTPNWNGFQLTGAVQEALGQTDNNNLGFAAKATYDFAANDVTGRVWVGGLTTKRTTTGGVEYDVDAWDIGGKVAYAGAELVGYYYDMQNMDAITSNAPGVGVIPASGSTITDTDGSGGYVQATYKLPTIGTKIGASWGTSKLNTATTTTDAEREAWIVGAYHPLTKSLNLVAEYNHLEQTKTTGTTGQAKTVSLGAILFF